MLPLSALAAIKLPRYMSKRQLIRNYLLLSLKTSVWAYRKGVEYRTVPFHDSDLPSGVWGEFTKIFEVYFQKISAREMLDSFIVRRTMLPASFKEFERFTQNRAIIEDYFTSTEVPERVQRLLEAVPKTFSGVSRSLIENWLWSYFWPFYLFREHISRDDVIGTMPVELGAGTGLFNLAIGGATGKCRTAVFDLPVVLHLQRIIANVLAKKKILVPETYRTSDINELASQALDQPYSVYSFWAFTEFPSELREKALPLFQKSDFSIIASNPVFEGVDNRNYFKTLAERMPGKSVHYAPIDWHPYPGHTYILIK